jgi:alkaline phosphatase/alkaline phosphatase D
MAIVTGMNYSFFHYAGSGRTKPYTGPDRELGYPALAAVRKLKPDYFVGTGDNVYYDHPGHCSRAQTQHEMRKKHYEHYSQPRFLDLFREVATYWMKDDHDHRFNDSDQINPVMPDPFVNTEVRVRLPPCPKPLPETLHRYQRPLKSALTTGE